MLRKIESDFSTFLTQRKTLSFCRFICFVARLTNLRLADANGNANDGKIHNWTVAAKENVDVDSL